MPDLARIPRSGQRPIWRGQVVGGCSSRQPKLVYTISGNADEGERMQGLPRVAIRGKRTSYRTAHRPVFRVAAYSNGPAGLAFIVLSAARR